MLTTQKISKPLSRAESVTIMSTILDRYRWRSEATARRASAELAISSPRLLPLLSIFSLPSILQAGRDKTLGHPAFPLRTTLSLANLHHGAYPPQQAGTPPNLNLFRRDSFVFVWDFSRAPKHRVYEYLLHALGMKVSVKMLPDIYVRELMGGPMQIVILPNTRTRLLLEAHLRTWDTVYEWAIGKVKALANHPNSQPGRTRAGLNNYPRNKQASPPPNQWSSAELHQLKRLRRFAPKHVDEPLRYCLDDSPEFPPNISSLLEGLGGE
jgi:hypothetical protein